MDLFTRDTLRELIAHEQRPAVSIYLPTVRMGREIQQNPIRWKNVLKQAEAQLRDYGLSGSDVKDFLAEPHRLDGDSVWWENQSDGLAAFVSPQRFERYRLPLQFEELVAVAARFHVKPILPVLEGDGEFYILAVSQNDVRLLRSSRYSVSELDPRGLPKNLRDALNIDEYTASLQYHTTERGGVSGGQATFHGHGGSNLDVVKRDEIRQYFRAINGALMEFFREERTPLVFAGVDYLFPIFQETSGYNRLIEQPVAGNPDELSAADLRKKAWAVVEPLFAADRTAALERYGKAYADSLASSDLKTVLQAARDGRVDTLFVAKNRKVCGKLHESSGILQVQELAEGATDAEDLLNYAVERTLLTSGTVYTFEEDHIPGREALAAIFRYPV
jgi:hypothetical protein